MAFYSVFYLVTHCLISGKSIDNIFRVDIVLSFVLTNTPFKYTHLWFLFALMYCYIFSFAIDKRISGKWKIYYALIILAFLSLSIEFIPPLKAFLQLDYFSVYNMFLFRALPFFLLGAAFREGILIPKFNMIALFICLMTSVVEYRIFGECQFYISSYFIAYLMFSYCLLNQNKSNRVMNYIGKNISMYVYVVHIAVRDSAYVLIQMFGLERNMIWTVFSPIWVLTISIFAGVFLYELKKKVQMKI